MDSCSSLSQVKRRIMVMPSRDQSSSTYKRKRVAELSPQPLVPRPSVFSNLIYPNAQKFSERWHFPVQREINQVILVSPVQPTQPVPSVAHPHVLPVSLFSKPNQFEIGTTSTAVLTKTQRRNRNRRIKKRMTRERQEKENEGMHESSSLLNGSRFHALFATEGEEDVGKILASPPRFPKAFKKLTHVLRNRKCEQQLSVIFQRTAEKSIMTEDVVIRRINGMNSQSLVASLMEEGKSPFDSTVEVQNKQRFARQLEVSANIDGHGTESQDRMTPNDDILLEDGTVSSSEVPLRFRRLPKEEDGSYILSDEPQVQDYALTTSVSHSNSKVKEKVPMKANSDEESVPSPVNHGQRISGKPIEELMDDLRESLCKMDDLKERLHKIGEKDFDKDNDDSIEEELYGFKTRRSSSLPGDLHTDELEVETKDGGDTALIQQLLQELKRKDEYIMKIEKIMEEMTTTITTLTAQLVGSQQTLVVEKLSVKCCHY